MPARKHIVRPSYVQARPDQILFDFEAFDLKRCCRCGVPKPMDQFHRWNKSPDGRQPRCKACRILIEGSESYKEKSSLLASGLKQCTACGSVKPLDEFYRNNRLRGRVHCHCKECVFARWQERYRVNTAKYYAWAQGWRVVNRAKANAWARRYREKKGEAYRNYQKEWNRKNHHLILAREAERRRRDRLAYNLRKKERYIRKRDTSVVAITPDKVALKFSLWGNRCWMCGKPAQSIDHVKPLSRGGPHILANLRPACRSCNSSKGAKWPFHPMKG